MAFSVNTNAGAMAALQSLNASNKQMSVTQSRINTGMAVSSTKDDSAKYTVAQKLRGDLGKLSAVTSSLNNAKSVTDVATAGVEQISDILNQMKSKAQEAADPGLQATSRTAITKDLNALKSQINTIINASDFNGTNVLKKNGGAVAGLQSFQDSDSTTAGYQSDNLTGVANLALDDTTTGLFKAQSTTAGTPGGLGDMSTAITLSSASDAGALVESLDAMSGSVATNLSDLGSASRQIEGQLGFTSKLSDVITAGVGNLVDADLAKESAKLQSLQVQQQLGVQALSIANQAPQTIMSLFR